MAKRPQGLNKAFKNKKKKVDDKTAVAVTETTTTDTPTPDIDDADDPQVAIELDEEIDIDDDLGQLNALYKSFLNSPRDNPRVLHGVIHECDSLLQKSKGEGLAARFHWVYGSALLDMAKFAPKKELKKKKKVKTSDNNADTADMFVSAALERISTGLEQHPSDADLLFLKAKALVNDIDETMGVCPPMSRADTAEKIAKTQVPEVIEVFTKAKSAALDSKKFTSISHEQLDTLEELIELSGSLESLVEDQEVFSDVLEATKNIYKELLDSVPEGKGKAKIDEADEADNNLELIRKANRGMGRYFLACSEPFVAILTEQDDDEDDDEDDEAKNDDDDSDENEAAATKEATKLLDKAIGHFKQAEDQEDGEFLVTVAEAMIQYGNLLESESEAQKHWYKEAVSRLRQAQRLGVGKYDEIIMDLEDDE